MYMNNVYDLLMNMFRPIFLPLQVNVVGKEMIVRYIIFLHSMVCDYGRNKSIIYAISVDEAVMQNVEEKYDDDSLRRTPKENRLLPQTIYKSSPCFNYLPPVQPNHLFPSKPESE